MTDKPERRAAPKRAKKPSDNPATEDLAIWLDAPTNRILDKKRSMTGETRVAFVRRIIREHW